MGFTRPEIAGRAAVIWPLGTVPYSMDTRRDCSDFVADVLGLVNPSAWNTVNLVTGGAVVAITFDQAEPGDVWGEMGPGTYGADGHTAIITGTPRTRSDGRWEVIEQTGPDGNPGPHRNVYRNPPAGYGAYRAVWTMEDEMSDQMMLWLLCGADANGAADPAKETGDRKLIAERVSNSGFGLNLQAIAGRLAALEDKPAGTPGAVDLDQLADLVVDRLAARLAQ